MLGSAEAAKADGAKQFDLLCVRELLQLNRFVESKRQCDVHSQLSERWESWGWAGCLCLYRDRLHMSG